MAPKWLNMVPEWLLGGLWVALGRLWTALGRGSLGFERFRQKMDPPMIENEAGLEA